MWLFVPIYGWTKYAAMLGLLSRLTYQELSGNPESVREARRQIKPRTWFFFTAGIKGTLILYGIGILLYLGLLYIVSRIFSSSLSLKMMGFIWSAIALLFLYYWYELRSRLFLYELPIAVEETTNISQAMDTGWYLVEDFITPVQISIILISVVATLPTIILSAINNLTIGINLFSSILGLGNFVPNVWLIMEKMAFVFFGVVFIPFFPYILSMFLLYGFNSVLDFNNINSFSSSFSLLFTGIITISATALIIPLCQSIKAVIYHRLRNFS